MELTLFTPSPRSTILLHNADRVFAGLLGVFMGRRLQYGKVGVCDSYPLTHPLTCMCVRVPAVPWNHASDGGRGPIAVVLPITDAL